MVRNPFLNPRPEEEPPPPLKARVVEVHLPVEPKSEMIKVDVNHDHDHQMDAYGCCHCFCGQCYRDSTGCICTSCKMCKESS